MKNLRIYSTFTTKDNEQITAELEGAQKMCVDTLNGEVYLMVDNCKLIILDRHLTLSKTINLPLAELNIEDDSRVLRLDFLADDQRLCLIYDYGQIVTVDISDQKVRKVCELKKRISGCAWSPDLQLLAIGSETHLFMLSKISQLHDQDCQGDFKLLTETSIRPTTQGKDQLTTIGWGAVETQFQGSAGKHNREKQNPSKIPVPIRGEFDSRNVLISWRADGQFFAVSTVDEMFISKSSSSPNKNFQLEKIPSRQIRIWNRDLQFMSQCEFAAGIEAALCMRPTGNLIAVPRISENDRFIWLFERNGQYRNKFKLSASKCGNNLVERTVIRQLAWNLDSSILAIYFYDKDGDINQLQFWTVSNYSWTEKLRLDVPAIADCFWDVEFSHKFHYVTTGGEYHQISLQSLFNCDQLLALSLNGDKMRITDFKLATIPPPMCHFELQLGNVGVPSSFAHSSKFGLALIGSDCQSMSIFSQIERKFDHRKDLKLAQNDSLLYNLIWRDENSILALRRKNGTTEIVEIRIDTEESLVIHTCASQVFAQFIPNSHAYLRMRSDSSLQSLECHYVKTDNESNDRILLVGEGKNTFSDQSYQIELLQLGKENLLFILTGTFILFVNGAKLHSSVGSFCFTDEFLLVLTLENDLFCIGMNSLLNFLANKSSADPKQLFCSGRQIERGAQLVANEQSGTRVWLQMRRGNLELINPRDMVIQALQKTLDARQWRQAFLEMRRHRIDLNLLFDHNPKTFMENLEDFVNQIGDVDHLNIFLTSLTTVDTTTTMFAPQYPENEQQKNRKLFEGKINTICERIRNILLAIDDVKRKIHFYPVVLTSFIIEKPSKISSALLNMQNLIRNLNGESSPQITQRWLRHINYLVNEEVLLKQALKTYDLEIVLMVAQSTNLDPKEYLPILNGLRDRSPMAYQAFHIDMLLEDWPSAMEQIAELTQEEKEAGDNNSPSSYLEECIGLIEQHNLHAQALRLFSGKTHFKEICKVAAKASEEQGFLKEAAILYEKGEDNAAALNCLFNVHDFHGYLRLAKSVQLPAVDIEKALKKMAVFLTHKADHLSAAEVYAHLGKEASAEHIFDCYSKAGAWAKLVAFLDEFGGRSELHVNRSRVVLSTRCTQVMEQVDEWRDAISKHAKRLEGLREEKAAKLKQMKEHPENEEFNDDASSQSSNASFGTQKSFLSTATSRRKKRTDRKKQQIKEGSQWEDGALLVALKAIYTGINRQQDELVELLPALLAMDLIEKGRRLQTEMAELVSFASALLPKIWPERLELHHLPGPIAELFRDNDGQVRWPIVSSEMPASIQLDDEMHRPKLKSPHEWRLNIFQ